MSSLTKIHLNVRSVWRCIQWLAVFEPMMPDLLHSNLTAHFIGAWAARMTLKYLNCGTSMHYPFTSIPADRFNRLIGANFYLFTTQYIRSG